MDKQTERDPIPQFDTLDGIAEFWDSHSTADYDDLTEPVQFEVKLPREGTLVESVKLLPELGETLAALADARGVSLETLVNAWLTEKVCEQA